MVKGRTYGPSDLFSATPPFAPFTANPSASSGRPQYLMDNIAKARQYKVQLLAGLPCGAHSATHLGACLVMKNGVAVFSQARFDSAMALFNTPELRAALAQSVKDSVLVGVNIMDEPWVSGTGDGNTWGPPGTMTRARVDSLCRSVKTILGPTVPVGTSDLAKWQRTGPWQWCDIGVTQYSYRFGDVIAWKDSILSASQAQGYMAVFGSNIIDGGTRDTDGTWDCAAQGGVKGLNSPNCQMTPSQVVFVGVNLGDAGCGPLGMWRYDATRFALPGFATAFAQVSALQLQRPQRMCRVR